MTTAPKTLKRRAAKLETVTEQRESWRGSPEFEERLRISREFDFCQIHFMWGGFYDLARRWGLVMLPDSDKALLDTVREWARRFHATPEQAEAAIRDTERGLAEPFESREVWRRWWFGEDEPGRSHASGYGLSQWLKTGPPRWEIAVVMDFSKHSPGNHKGDNPVWFQQPLPNAIYEVDKAFHGPRARAKERRLEEVRRSTSAA